MLDILWSDFAQEEDALAIQVTERGEGMFEYGKKFTEELLQAERTRIQSIYCNI